MTNDEILRRIDHTLLKAVASWDDVRKLCGESVQYKTASVCIPPCYVAPAKAEFGSALTVCTVIGFPLGYSVTAAKIAEAEQALGEGAAEIDMVINICQVKNKRFDDVQREIAALRKCAGNAVLKVIVETCYLSREEKIALCGIVTDAGADFIKTSTGFGTAGAALEDIALFKAHIGSGVQIKASGGIKTREALEAFITAGAARIGTSSGVELLA
ncbi:MAG: deoxyribose-phosphate aldolase [Treponemataceae bacterium]|nr:MAG: deoxyribose-phosphate aldolase [Treponemataceae bacterium]